VSHSNKAPFELNAKIIASNKSSFKAALSAFFYCCFASLVEFLFFIWKTRKLVSLALDCGLLVYITATPTQLCAHLSPGAGAETGCIVVKYFVSVSSVCQLLGMQNEALPVSEFLVIVAAARATTTTATTTHSRNNNSSCCVCMWCSCSFSSCSCSSSSCHALGKVENSISCFSCMYVSRTFVVLYGVVVYYCCCCCCCSFLALLRLVLY